MKQRKLKCVVQPAKGVKEGSNAQDFPKRRDKNFITGSLPFA